MRAEGGSLAADLPEGIFRNVGYLYAQFAKDLRDNTQIAPNFAAGLTRHRLIDTIQASSESGRIQQVADKSLTDELLAENPPILGAFYPHRDKVQGSDRNFLASGCKRLLAQIAKPHSRR